MEYIAIRLPIPNQSRVDWLIWSSSEQEIIASGVLTSLDSLSTLKEKSPNAHVIAIAPSSTMGFKEVTLPAKTNRKILNAVPYMLEEDIAQDVSDCFFAFAERHENLQQVIYCERSLVQGWLTAFSNAHWQCDQLIPDVMCLPYENSHISALQIEDELIVRTGEFEGYQAESDWLAELAVQHARNSQKGIKAFSELPATITQIPDVQIVASYDVLPMQLLLQGARESKVNLLQGEFKIRRKTSGDWQKWKIAAGLAALALFVNLADTLYQTNQLKAEREQVRLAIQQATQRGFPNLGKVLNHRRIIAREMNKLEQGGGNVSMLAILSRLTPVFSASGVTPQSIRFDAKRSEIRMQSIATNFESLEQFKRQAQQLGYDVEQGAINNRGDEVSGALVIKG